MCNHRDHSSGRIETSFEYSDTGHFPAYDRAHILAIAMSSRSPIHGISNKSIADRWLVLDVFYVFALVYRNDLNEVSGGNEHRLHSEMN